MLAAMAMHHVLIVAFRREEYRSRSAVGYSAVLFAWMSVATLRLQIGAAYCPLGEGMLSLNGALCFATWRLPLPPLAPGRLGTRSDAQSSRQSYAGR